jgi:hypothetical protein
MSWRPGGYGQSDFWVTRRTTENDPWGEPVNLGPVVNSAYNESYLGLSPDGLLLLFSESISDRPRRPGGYGGSDMWMSRRASLSAPWQAPVNLGPKINSPFGDWLPRISSDGRTLYFLSDRTGWECWQVSIDPVLDFNADGTVDAADITILAANLGKNMSLCDIGPFPWGDGVVDEKDLSVFVEEVTGSGLAVTPPPQALQIPRDVILGWTSIPFVQCYDVYFGTSFEAVRNASRVNSQGVLVSQGQTATTCDPPGPLEYGRTYYWRVDSTILGPTLATCTGPVLSFTTEPFAYPIKNVTAEASRAMMGTGPEKTVDGSGLDKNDGHSISGSEMWLSQGTQPNWIQYAFDKVYTLHELWVWNQNQAVEPFIGLGAKTVRIEYSKDGAEWTPLADVPEFARAPGQPGYTYNTTVSFGGISAKYVKLTIEKGWGATPSVGLSEMRFFYIPDRSATKP